MLGITMTGHLCAHEEIKLQMAGESGPSMHEHRLREQYMLNLIGRNVGEKPTPSRSSCAVLIGDDTKLFYGISGAPGAGRPGPSPLSPPLAVAAPPPSNSASIRTNEHMQ